jgi:hypothetical protein
MTAVFAPAFKPAVSYRAFEYHQGFIKRAKGTRTVPVAPYTPKEVAVMLGFSAATIRAMIKDDPGVHRVVGPNGKVTSKIPEEVVSRFRARLVRDTLKPVIAPQVPRRVVFLSDRHRRVA